MAAAKKRSSANRAYYEKKRKKILNRAKRYYKANRAKILARQKKYRMKTKAGTAAYKPLYARGSRRGKRPLFARLPRVNVYSFIGRRRSKNSKALGRKAPSFKRTNVKPRSGGGRAFRKRA